MNLKTILIGLLVALSSAVFSQAAKPTIMVVPSDVWCTNNGYMTEYDNQGTKTMIPDYKRAFQTNSELVMVISSINGLMAERGFPLESMQKQIKILEENSAEDAMMSSKSGGETAISPVDKLKMSAKADIIIQITWVLNQTGPKKSISFNLAGIDSYTGKEVATAVGVGPPSFVAETQTLLNEAVLSHLDNFNSGLMTHFEDMFENGRECIIRVKRWDDWEEDLETEYEIDGEELELSEIIENWMDDNCVKGRNSLFDGTENMMLFKQVRIPMFYEYKDRKKAMTTKKFARKLSKYLKSEFEIISKVTNKGQGRATLYLGSK